jgi:hypothetical protein
VDRWLRGLTIPSFGCVRERSVLSHDEHVDDVVADKFLDDGR